MNPKNQRLKLRMPLLCAQVVPTSKIPAPLLVGGAPKKDKRKQSEKKSENDGFGFGGRVKKFKKVLRPRQTSSMSRKPEKRQLAAAFSNILADKRDQGGRSD